MKARDLKKMTKAVAAELRKPLPAEDVRLKMAPSSRRLSEFPAPDKLAAVMILMFPSQDEICICFIRRPEYEGVHSGQISFPGGMYEITDKDLEQTARRETTEETGIDGAGIIVLGKLTPLEVPVSHFLVHPYVGYIDHFPEFVPDPAEVSFMITVPLRDLMDPSIILKEKWNLMDESVLVPFYFIQDQRIWGATAMILSEFLEVISRAGQVHHYR